MSRGCVTRACRPPAPVLVPSWLNNWALLDPKNGKGGAKLAWFKKLKNSARNCMLKLSETLRTAKFLYTEKSKLARPGPTMLLRPALPSRFEQVPGMPALG